MFELPRREKEILVEVEDGAVKLFLEPLTDEQYFRVTEVSEVEGTGEESLLRFRPSRLPGLFEDRLRRADGLSVDGVPFDRTVEEHLSRIPQPWKGQAVGRLIRYAMGLTSEMGNASPPRDAS